MVFYFSLRAKYGIRMPSFYSVVLQYLPIVRQVYNPSRQICVQHVTEMVCAGWEEMLEGGQAESE